MNCLNEPYHAFINTVPSVEDAWLDTPMDRFRSITARFILHDDDTNDVISCIMVVVSFIQSSSLYEVRNTGPSLEPSRESEWSYCGVWASDRMSCAHKLSIPTP
jgi:hypothetical protein